MTRRVLEKEVLDHPTGSQARLVKAWDKEIGRRVTEIQSGAEQGIPASQVMKIARHVLAGNRLARTRK